MHPNQVDISYGHPDPLSRRFSRAIPRLSLWAWLLLPTAAGASVWFAMTCSVWEGRLICQTQSNQYTHQIRVSPDRTNVVIDRTVFRVLGISDYSLSGGQERYGQTLPGMVDPEQSISISIHGSRQIAWDENLNIWLLDQTDGRLISHYTHPNDWPAAQAPQLSSDGTRLIAVDDDGICLFNALDGSKIRALQGTNASTAIWFQNAQRSVVFWGPNSAIHIYSLDDGRLLHTGAITPQVAWTIPPDGSAIASINGDTGMLRIQETTSPRERITPAFVTKDPAGWIKMIYSPDGRKIVVLDRSQLLFIDAGSGAIIGRQTVAWQGGGWEPDFLFSPDGRWLILWPVVYDMRTRTPAATLAGTSWYMAQNGTMPFSPDSQRLALGTTVWDTRSWKPTSTIPVQQYIQELAWAGNDQLLTRDAEGDCMLWTARRPAAWWGVAALPQCWLALIAAVACAWRWGVELRRWYRPAGRGY